MRFYNNPPTEPEHQPLHEDDELINALHSTIPQGDPVRQQALKARLLDQLQQGHADDDSLTNGVYRQRLSFAGPSALRNRVRRFPAVLAATLLLIFLGGIILISTRRPDSTPGASPGQPSATPTDIQCEAHLIQRIRVPSSIPLYTLPDVNAAQLATLATGNELDAIGRSRDGQWLVVDWQGPIIGWVQLASVEVIDCAAPPASGPTSMPATAAPNVEGNASGVADAASQAVVHSEHDISVHATDSVDSEVLGVLTPDMRMPLIGANQAGDWFVILWQDDQVGWVPVTDVEVVAVEDNTKR